MFGDILVFILFISILIFFHELGHFLFARYFGVKVETFSIGFGPKILKKKVGDTEYALSAIPFGGYVKMFGDNILERDDIPEHEKQYAFTCKSKWARFWIVFGGPLANFLLAYVIFFGLLLSGEKVPEPKVGIVKKESVFHQKGLRTGDLITAVNSKEVIGYTDVAQNAGTEVKSITVNRFGQTVSLENINLSVKDFMETMGSLLPAYRKPIFLDKNGKRWLLVKGNELKDSQASIAELLSAENATYSLFEMDALDKPMAKSRLEMAFEGGGYEEKLNLLADSGFLPIDLKVKNAIKGAPADKAGLKTGDVLVSLNGVKILGFEELRSELQKTKEGEKVALKVYRKGEVVDLSIAPAFKKAKDVTVVSIGVESGLEFFPPKLVESKSKGFFASFYYAGVRTVEATGSIIDGFVKLVTKEVSLKNVGGPLSIAKVASDSFDISLSYFFKIMALISINLGVINLFPIPVLDGGHIVFLFIEFLNGGPLSRRKTEIALQFGLSILLLLFVAAIYNDISRFISG